MQRLKFLGLMAVILAAFTLGSCDDNSNAVKSYAADETGVAQCQKDYPDQAAQCEKALAGAQAEQERTVQHYTLGECMDQFGPSACQPRDSGAYFVPAMAAFTFGYLAGSAPVYHPVYVNLNGQAYYGHTLLGSYHPGTSIYIRPAPRSTWVSTYHVRTVSIPARTPVSPPSYNYGAPKIERGGFGGGASVTRQAAPTTSSAPAPAPSTISRGGFGGTTRSTTRGR